MGINDIPQIDGYKILKRIGRGGMASVYLATQEKFQRNVALKIMSPHLLADDSFGERFLREAHTVAKLSHQNIIPVYDVGQVGDYHYLAMEYLPDGDLKAAMQKNLSIEDGLKVVLQLAHGLHYAARKNCVHRDIKPDNILFREDMSPVICDFGIARNQDTTQMTVVGTVIGTPHYMSPEQALSKKVDGRSDLYSLGIILYELLTGNVPFSGDSAVSIGIFHSTKDVPPLPSELAAFQPFIDRALAKSPDHRFQDGQAFAAALAETEYRWRMENQDEDQTVFLDGAHFRRPATPVNLDMPEDATVPRSPENQQYFAPAQKTTDTYGAPASDDQDEITRFSPHRSSVNTPEQHNSPAKSSPQPVNNTAVAKIADKLNELGTVKLAAIGIVLIAVTITFSWFISDNTSETPLDIANIGNLSDKIAALNTQAQRAVRDDRLFQPKDNSAHYYLTTLLTLAPKNEEGLAGMASLFSKYLSKAKQSIATGFYESGDEWLSYASQLTYYIDDRQLLKTQKLLQSQLLGWKQEQLITKERKTQINRLVERASIFLADDKLTTPASGNAFDSYREALSIDPENRQALAGIDAVARRFTEQASDMATAGDFARAGAFIAAAQQVSSEIPEIQRVKKLLSQQRDNTQPNTLTSSDSALIERSLADAKIREESLRNAGKVQQLLDEAGFYIDNQQFIEPYDANALDSYKKVFVIDPANADALRGIENVTQRVLAQVDDTIESDNLSAAAELLSKLNKVNPAANSYRETESKLLTALKTKQARLASEAANKEEISLLSALANQQITANDIYSPSDRNALSTLTKILALDTNNKEAITLQESIFEKLNKQVLEQINQREFEPARQIIVKLKQHGEKSSNTNSLDRRLKDAEKNLDNMIKSDELVSSIAPKDAAKVTYRNYTSLARTYSQALRLYTNNSNAKTGLKNVNAYIKRQFKFAIDEYDFEKASNLVSTYKKTNGNTKTAQKFDAQIKTAKNTRKQVINLLNEADQIIDTPFKKPGIFGSNKANLRQLRGARLKVERAQQLDPKNAVLRITLGRLEKKYASIIQLYLNKNKLKEARKFFDDAKLINSSHAYLDKYRDRVSN